MLDMEKTNIHIGTTFGGRSTIHENLDSSYIRGVGTQVVETGGGNTHFEGSISIREIKDIEVLEFSNITPIVIGAFVAIIVIGSVYMFFLRYDIK